MCRPSGPESRIPRLVHASLARLPASNKPCRRLPTNLRRDATLGCLEPPFSASISIPLRPRAKTGKSRQNKRTLMDFHGQGQRMSNGWFDLTLFLLFTTFLWRCTGYLWPCRQNTFLLGLALRPAAASRSPCLRRVAEGFLSPTSKPRSCIAI